MYTCIWITTFLHKCLSSPLSWISVRRSHIQNSCVCHIWQSGFFAVLSHIHLQSPISCTFLVHCPSSIVSNHSCPNLLNCYPIHRWTFCLYWFITPALKHYATIICLLKIWTPDTALRSFSYYAERSWAICTIPHNEVYSFVHFLLLPHRPSSQASLLSRCWQMPRLRTAVAIGLIRASTSTRIMQCLWLNIVDPLDQVN